MTEKINGKWLCKHCKKEFRTKREMRSHRLTCELNLHLHQPINCTCEWCGESFPTINQMRKHLLTCIDRKKKSKLKEGGWDCVCGENFRTRRLLQEHKKTCEAKTIYKGKNKKSACIKYVDYTCQFCKKGFIHKPINSKTLHEKQCYQNPNRIPNKQTGHRMSDEQKQKISSTMKKKIADGSFIVPYKRNHSSKVSYPEQYFMEVFKELNLEYNYQVGLYQLDFADPNRKIYIEIDGEQHYVDKKIVQHDIERTEKLTELGWKCLQRVRWSDFQKLNDEQKVEFCKNLINNINNY